MAYTYRNYFLLLFSIYQLFLFIIRRRLTHSLYMAGRQGSDSSISQRKVASPRHPLCLCSCPLCCLLTACMTNHASTRLSLLLPLSYMYMFFYNFSIYFLPISCFACSSCVPCCCCCFSTYRSTALDMLRFRFQFRFRFVSVSFSFTVQFHLQFL